METNTTASNNTAVGSLSLQNNTTGSGNTAIGYTALRDNTTASSNTAVGKESLRDCTTGQNNTSVGEECGLNMTTGDQNVAVGSGALMSCTTGSQNTCVGGGEQGNNNAAGQAITVGQNNTLIGRRAGCTITNGSNNVCIGNSAGRQLISGGDNNCYIARDNNAAANASTWLYGDGNGACTQGNNSSSWTTTSDRRLKKDIVDNTKGLTEVNQMRVTNFLYRTEDEIDMSEFPLADEPFQVVIGKGKEGETQTGVIAQEIEQILPECIEVSDRGAKTVNTDPILWALVNAVKELSAKVTALEAG